MKRETMTDESAITFDGVTRTFGDLKALDGMSLTVEPGRIYGLIGPDGAGKTTAMRILATVLKPTSGWASVFGHDVVRDPWPIKHRIGYMPQNFSLYLDLSVSENISFYAGIYRAPASEMSERVKWLLDFTGLEPFTGRLAEALSGGMKQKLALACALIHRPELLLLDEPTTGVDPVARREFWKNIENLSAQGLTVFVSTPYMDEADRCRRISFIDGGRIVREGEVDQLKKSAEWRQFIVRGPDLRKAQKAIKGGPGILGAQLVGTMLRVQAEPDMEPERLRKLLPGEGHTVEESRPTLEDVFAYILGKTRSGSDEK